MVTESKPLTDQPQVASTAESNQVASMESAVGAAFLASGIGSVVLGILVVLSEANAGIKTFLTFNTAVGPLSGKVILTVIGFVLSWIILHFALRERHVKLQTSFTIGIILLVVGLLLTFPPIFLLFES